jgi:TorA maturation chaperone TorD
MTPVQSPTSAFDEETARAEVYGLLATLFHAAPSPQLHESLALAVTQAPAPGALLETSWREVVSCARHMTADAIAAEFTSLFVGVGKPEINVFGSHYLSGFLNEKPLVILRTDIAALGLARNEDVLDTEDHISYVFEVMRYLIAGDDVEISNLTRQREFFTRHVHAWVPAFCEALAGSPKAKCYGALASFTEVFISVEAQSFDMLA